MRLSQREVKVNIFETTVVSTRIRLARNINGLPFPNRLRGEEQIYSVLYAGVKKACDRVFANDYYSIDLIVLHMF